MLCNFLTNNILGREGLLCPNGIQVKRFKHLMLLRLPSGHSRRAAFLMFFITVTVHLHCSYYKVTLVQQCRLVKILTSLH